MARSPLTSPLVITQRFGVNPKQYPYTNGHPGIDLRSPNGDDWVSCVMGFVHFYNMNIWDWTGSHGQPGYRGYGAVSCVDWGQADGSFVRFLYGHGKNRRKQLEGHWVNEGVYLAESGNTGRSTAYHLHFELRHYQRGGKYYDGTARLYYDLMDPEKDFLKHFNLKYTYA